LTDFKGDEIDDNSRDNEQDQVFYFIKAVEKIAGGQEVYPAEALGYKEVEQENDAEEDKKFDRVKYHFLMFSTYIEVLILQSFRGKVNPIPGFIPIATY
jgi:hypothetical protein